MVKQMEYEEYNITHITISKHTFHEILFNSG